jgi:hypothetical protein
MTDDELSKLLADTTTPDMISREDAIRALTEVAIRFGITGEPQIMIVAKDAIRAIPTAPAPAVDVASAAQSIVDNVLDQPSERAVKLRTQMDDELSKLLAEATPGPWVPMGKPTIGFMMVKGQPQSLRGFSTTVCHMDGVDTGSREREANARLIAAAPTLAAEVLALRAERDAWRKLSGDIAALVPIPEVIKATGTIGDLVAWLTACVKEREALRDKLTAAEAALSEARAEGMRAAAAIVDGYADGIVNELAKDYIRMAARYALAASGGAA